MNITTKDNENFVKEVRKIRDLVFKLESNELLSICTKWLNIFSKASLAEKTARDALVSLLQQQLQVNGKLSAPFTLVQNANFDLCSIYNNLNSLENGLVNSTTCESLKHANAACSENLEKFLLENKNQLQQQKTLMDALDKLKTKHVNLSKIIKASHKENVNLTNDIETLKGIFSRSLISTLKLLKEEVNTSEYVAPKFFASLFSVFVKDKNYRDDIAQLDKRFQHLLQKSIENYAVQQKGLVVAQTSKDYDKLKSKIDQKYKKAKHIQQKADEHLLALSEMRNLEVLRKIFMDTFKGNEKDINIVLRILQQHYTEAAKHL